MLPPMFRRFIFAAPIFFAASSALATLWRRMPFHMPRGTADSDVLMLELLAAVVLLIVAATIILTLWFTRPLLYRHRR